MTELELKQQADIKELVDKLRECKVIIYNTSHRLQTTPLIEVFVDIDLIINKHS